MTHTLRTLDDLVSAGLVAADAQAALQPVSERYAIAVTPAMNDLINRADPHDPIGLQFIPDSRELTVSKGEADDPIGDFAHSPLEGLVHRYPDRVLVKLTHICPVYCRFCFRREMVGPGKSEALSEDHLDAVNSYIKAHPEIWEVIVTGGDPLILSPRRLQDFTTRLAAIDHVRVLRWHTRVPSVDPARVTDELARALVSSGKSVWLALHVNHPREMTRGCLEAIARLKHAGIHLISQSVLLKGVNDDVDTLADLMRAFVEAGVKPYYLHQGDLATGTAHFRTTIAEAKALIDGLRGRVSGLAQPLYVIDLPGGAGKVPVAALSCEIDGEGWRIRDWQGYTHAYPPVG